MGLVQGECAVPTGLRLCHEGDAFPTLKRGANQPCASGAVFQTGRAIRFPRSPEIAESSREGELEAKIVALDCGDSCPF
jgi:hypothetical protein